MANYELHDAIEDEELEAYLAQFLQYGTDPDGLDLIDHVGTYTDRGMLTMNKGLVLHMKSGQEFQLTIVRSR